MRCPGPRRPRGGDGDTGGGPFVCAGRGQLRARPAASPPLPLFSPPSRWHRAGERRCRGPRVCPPTHPTHPAAHPAPNSPGSWAGQRLEPGMRPEPAPAPSGAAPLPGVSRGDRRVTSRSGMERGGGSGGVGAPRQDILVASIPSLGQWQGPQSPQPQILGVQVLPGPSGCSVVLTALGKGAEGAVQDPPAVPPKPIQGPGR